MSQKQEIQLPAIRIPVFGLKDSAHMTWHGVKLIRNPFDAGVDLFASSLLSADRYDGWYELKVSTMFHMAFQPGSFGWVTDRSSTSRLTGGATVMPGVIDAGYTGELLIRLQVITQLEVDDFLQSDHQVIKALNYCIEKQRAIAQVIPLQSFMTLMSQVDPVNLPKHGRGNNGFGSTNQIG